MSRTKAYCFTINNPQAADLQALEKLPCEYLIYGKEVGEAGTPHLQGYVHFASQKTLSAVSKLLPRAYLDARKGSIDQAVDYCKKDGDWTESGKKPLSQKEKGQSEKTRWHNIIKRAREGDELWLEEEEPRIYAERLAMFRSHKTSKETPLGYADEDTPHEWWVGVTGSGKSRKLWAEHPGFYPKEQNKWWCNYRGQDVVAIEEASPKTMEHLGSRIKVWADRYPFPGEIKGGRIEGMRPEKIIVLSNYSIRECFPAKQDYEPLERRFRVKVFGAREYPIFNFPPK